jgi:hypothetical protein
VDALNFVLPERAVEISGLPTFDEVQARGLGVFLNGKRTSQLSR